MQMVIDAHQHFWQLDLGRPTGPFDYSWLDAEPLAPIRRDFLPEHLTPHLKAAGVDRSIIVQTQHHPEETRWALRLADENTFLAGVVGWVDLASPSCEEQLLQLKDHPKFVGVRHVTQDESDDDFIIRPDVVRGLKTLEKHRVPFDLLFYVKHLPHAAALAGMLPELPMVIDHLAKPRIKDGAADGWIGDFRAAGEFPNLYCKLSGMVTEADWQAWRPADLRPYVETALEVFGPQRLMFGSDWPVCELAGSYERVYAALAECLAPLSAGEREMIYGRTAAAFYGLSSRFG